MIATIIIIGVMKDINSWQLSAFETLSDGVFAWLVFLVSNVIMYIAKYRSTVIYFVSQVRHKLNCTLWNIRFQKIPAPWWLWQKPARGLSQTRRREGLSRSASMRSSARSGKETSPWSNWPGTKSPKHRSADHLFQFIDYDFVWYLIDFKTTINSLHNWEVAIW